MTTTTTDAIVDALYAVLSRTRGRHTVDAARDRLAGLSAAVEAVAAAGETTALPLLTALLDDLRNTVADLERTEAEAAAKQAVREAKVLDEARGTCSTGGQAFLDLDGGLSEWTMVEWLAYVETWAAEVRR